MDNNTSRINLGFSNSNIDLSTLFRTVHRQSPSDSSQLRIVAFVCGRWLRYWYEDSNNVLNLSTLLNEISNTSPNLDTIKIYNGIDPIVVREILLHFIRYENIKTFLLSNCNLSSFMLTDDFIDQKYIINYNKNNDSTGRDNLVSSTRKFHLIDTNTYAYGYHYNRDTIRTAIKNCACFTSWYIKYCNNKNAILILSALEQNRYIQSLHIHTRGRPTYIQKDILINSITNVVTNSTTLTKLSLDFDSIAISSANTALSNLAKALIKSESVTDLSFKLEDFDNNIESYQSMCSVLEKKTNIYKLKFDMNTWIYNKYYPNNFDSSIFTNLLLQQRPNNYCCNINNNNNNNITLSHKGHHLRELDIDFTDVGYNQTLNKEIELFFALIRDSSLEKLTIKFNNFCPEKLYDRLFIDTIPFLSSLQFLKFHTDNSTLFSTGLTRIKRSIGICNSRTLLEAHLTVDHDHRNEQNRIIKYLERNNGINTLCCIKNGKHVAKHVWPKMLYISKPTGTDTSFNILFNIGMSIGPNSESILTVASMTTKKKKRATIT